MKKLISTLMALSLTLTSMMALSSNATIYIYDSDSDEYQDILDGYSPIDTDIAKSYFSNWNDIEKNDKFYSNENGTHMIATRKLSSIVVFNLADGASAKDVRDVVWEYCADKETEMSYTAEKRVLYGLVEEDYEYEIYTYGQGSLGEPEYSVKVEDAKNLCKILKEKNLISGFKYVNRNQITYLDAGCTDYPLTSYIMPDIDRLPPSEAEKISRVQSYVAENLPDCELRVDKDEYGNQIVQFIPPNENASVEEIMEFAVKINEACGDKVCYGDYLSPTSLGASDTLDSSIDMYNAVSGDANCDGYATIADATLVLQFLTNADEYGLTEQGRYNADVCGNLDGVTALDALEIQKFDAQEIDKFE